MDLTSLRARLKYPKRIREAARQMNAVVRRGIVFEIPAALSTDDDTTKAVMCLQELYPDIPVAMLQSKVIVVGDLKRHSKVSPDAWAVLDKGNYLPGSEKAANPAAFLEEHAAFLQRNGHDAETVVNDALKAQAERDGIVVGSGTTP